MATVKQKGLSLDDTLGGVLSVLEDRPEIPCEKLKEIARQAADAPDRRAFRARVLELADAIETAT